MPPPFSSELAELSPRNSILGTGAAVWAFGLDLALPLAIAAALLAKAARLRRQAAAAAALERGADAPPREGMELARGVVEVEHGPAMTVSVNQWGKEAVYKKQWSTTWKELTREIRAKPFVLVMANGARLRCEPDRETRLLDDLDVTERRSLTDRVRRAQLVNGERAIVRGRVISAIGPGGGGAYREPAKELVMRPVAEISTKGLAAPFREAARLRTKWALWLLALTAAVLALLSPYVTSLVAGRVEIAEVRSVDSVRVRTKNGTKLVYHVKYQLPGEPGWHDEEIATSDVWKLQPGRPMPVRIGPLGEAIGSEPSVSVVRLVVGFALVAAAFFIGLGIIRSARPWWERANVQDDRRGRLADDLPPGI